MTLMFFLTTLPLDPILTVPLLIVLACLVLLVVGSVIRALRRRISESRPVGEKQGTEIPEEVPAIESAIVLPSVPSQIPPEQTAGFWWVKLLSGRAVLGLVFLPLQPIILIINSYILALRFELLLGRVGDPLFTLGVFGWQREITIYDLLGCLISLLQVILGAAFVHGIGKTGRLKWTSYLTLIALVSTIALEVTLSVQSGMADGDHSVLATLNGLLALSIALTDVVCGIYVIEHLLIPLTLAIAWSIASPFRAVATKIKTRAARSINAREVQPAKAQVQGKVGDGRWVIRSLDDFFRAILLKDIDAAVLRRLRSTKKVPSKKVKEEICLDAK